MDHGVVVIWIRGEINLVILAKRTDSPLTQALVHTMCSGCISIDQSEY